MPPKLKVQIVEDSAVAAMKAGANDYVMKDKLERLGPAVERRKRKQAEEELRASEERFRQLVENIHEVYWIRDGLTRRILYISPAYETIWGRTTEEVYRNGMSFMENVHPEDKERISVSHSALYDEGRMFDEEYRMIRPDGSVRWVRTRTYPVFDQNRKVIRHVGIAEDITDRKQAENLLVESERRFRQLSELLPQIVFETDIKGNITFANQNGFKSFGYSLEDIQSGINIVTLVAPEERESIKGRLMEILGGSETAVREFQAIRKDGGKFPVLMHANAILEDGVPIGVRGIAIDITERKRAEEALRESEEKYRTVVENAAESILIAQDGRLKFVNRMATEITGYSEQELRSSPFLEFVHLDDRNMVGERYLRRLKGDASQPRDAFRLIVKDGSIKWVEIEAVLVAWEGKPATLNFLIDITERKKTEDKLRETLGGLRNALGGIIQVLSATTEKRDPYTAGHQRRVADLARAIGQEMGLAADRVEGLRIAGVIHDIGKVSIPAEILSKPTRLTEIEYKLIQTHSQVGHDILENIDFAWPIAKMILQHHERINGSGYPNQLKDDEILLEARILAVSDIVEAMASHRPYRPSLGIEAALEEIEKNKGILYDPDVASACLTLFREKGFTLK
ncbi:MAG: PAS domain S-box protein [Candidatus Aminicenantes bacterium]|nr:PAS domain S-box protein [Candidatus Aminicenantes bacterium]